ASAISTQAPQGQQNISIDDRKQKLVVFPSVTAGDHIVYTTRRQVKHPFFPGYFTLADAASRTISMADSHVTIVAPNSMPLRVETHGVDFAKEEGDTTITYRLAYRAPDALAEDNAQLAALDVNPRYFVSSFKDYDDLGREYASITTPLTAVTAKI